MTGWNATGGGSVANIKSTVEERGAAGSVGPIQAEPVPKSVTAQDYVNVALMVLIGSTTAPAAKYVVQDFPVFLIPLMRFALAALCLLPVVWARGGLGRLIRQDGWRLLLTAALCVPVNQGFFLSATRLVPTSHVGLFYATCPLVVLLLAWATRLERPDRARLWGVLTSVGGIVVIGLGHLWGNNGGAAGTGRDGAARRPAARGSRHVVGRLHCGQQAVDRAAWCDACPGRYIPGRLLARRSVCHCCPPGGTAARTGLDVRVAWLGVSGAYRHSVWVGVPEFSLAALRRLPGSHFQQRVASLDRHLGDVALR